jgi:hypothetical protein
MSCDHRNEPRYLEMKTLSVFINRESQTMAFATFSDGLGLESVVFLDSSSGGSFAHLTLSECKDILGKILENTPYTGVFDEFPDEELMPNILSEPKPIEEEPIFAII